MSETVERACDRFGQNEGKRLFTEAFKIHTYIKFTKSWILARYNSQS